MAAGPDADGDLQELRELLATAGVACVGSTTQRRVEVHPDSYLGTGRAEELAAEIKDSDANIVVCDDELTPRQERRLEKLLDLPVIDRTAVILDIFAQHAGSAEGKLQVELAQLEYNLARMRGLWTHLERLGGGIGTRGPGESQLETDRRLARDRIAAVRRRLTAVQKSRARMRAERTRSAVPSLALVGYTNAGKSTLLGAITGAEVSVRDELFHTLDPTTRAFEHRGRHYVATDTVGFIRKLPHQLVDAFSATLEETLNADLLLVISDASADRDEEDDRMSAVDATLDEIGAGGMPRLTVLNKIDLLDAGQRRELTSRHPNAIAVSAATHEGLDHLLDAVAASIRARLTRVDLLIPHGEGRVLADLHAAAGDLDREDRADGVLVHARLDAARVERYKRYAVGELGR